MRLSASPLAPFNRAVGPCARAMQRRRRPVRGPTTTIYRPNPAVPDGADPTLPSRAVYSTVTVLARLRGWSTLSPRLRAMW